MMCFLQLFCSVSLKKYTNRLKTLVKISGFIIVRAAKRFVFQVPHKCSEAVFLEVFDPTMNKM